MWISVIVKDLLSFACCFTKQRHYGGLALLLALLLPATLHLSALLVSSSAILPCCPSSPCWVKLHGTLYSLNMHDVQTAGGTAAASLIFGLSSSQTRTAGGHKARCTGAKTCTAHCARLSLNLLFFFGLQDFFLKYLGATAAVVLIIGPFFGNHLRPVDNVLGRAHMLSTMRYHTSVVIYLFAALGTLGSSSRKLMRLSAYADRISDMQKTVTGLASNAGGVVSCPGHAVMYCSWAHAAVSCTSRGRQVSQPCQKCAVVH